MSSTVKDEERDQSLLEDASTLLMFSKTTNEGRLEDTNAYERNEGSLKSHTDTPIASSGIAFSASNSRVAAPPSGVEDEIACKDSKNINKGLVANSSLAATTSMPMSLQTKDSIAIPVDSYVKNDHSLDEAISDNGQDNSLTEERTRELSDKGTDEGNILKNNKAVTVPQSYIVDPDDGIITCICGYDDDDGFTIQCDHCFRWQHAICYGIEAENDAPEDFLCNICSPRDVDVKGARKRQQERLRNIQSKKRRRSVNVPNKENKFKDSELNTKENTQVDSTEYVSAVATADEQGVNKSEHLRKQSYMTAKEFFPVVYLPLTKNDFKDKYVEIFVNKHSGDDWVIPYLKKNFKPIPTEVKPYAENSHSRVFPGFPKLGVYVKQYCEENDYIEEFLGEIDFQRKYLQDPRNNYRIWGTAKPKVLFHPHWPIYIDARLSGNLTRYLRRSCNPNVELVTLKTNSGNSQDAIKFVLKATRPIHKGEELCIKWDWDLRHPIWNLINSSASIETIEEPKRYLLIHSIDTVLGSCDCACGSTNKDCYLNKVRKFSQSLYKSVKSKMNNRYKLNEILHGKNLQNKSQVPILCKLAHDAISDAARASEILLRLNTSKLKGIEGCKTSETRKRTYSKSSFTPKAQKYSRMLNSLNTNTSQNISTVAINDPNDFDESNINDIEMLAIPVKIKMKESSTKDDGMSYSSSITKAGQENNSTDLTSVDTPGQSSTTTSINNQAPSQMKKKLSFADYKKKLKPT